MRLRAEIADHRATEAKLQRAQKMGAIGLFTAGVAHDFNNILMAIGGSARIDRESPRFRFAASPADQDYHPSRRASRHLDTAIAGSRSPAKAYAALCWTSTRLCVRWRQPLITTLGGHGSIDLQLAGAPAMAFVDKAQFDMRSLTL